ncbi:hypothetical protein ACFX13_047830 [Malus domestica]
MCIALSGHASIIAGNASSPILGLSSTILQAHCVEAMELALSLEKSTNEKLCSTCSVEAIKKISEYVAQL